MAQFRTTAAYLSGAICGPMWMGPKAGLPLQVDVRRTTALFVNGDGSFREFLDHVACERGGDFRHARFTADTVIRIERRAVDAPGKYRVHVKEIELGKLPGCADYVDEEAYSSDFMGEE